MVIYTLMNIATQKRAGRDTNLIYIFARSITGQFKIVTIKGFTPYFSIKTTPELAKKRFSKIVPPDYIWIDELAIEPTAYVKIDHRLVNDYIFPGDTVSVRERFEEKGFEHHEANMEFVLRYLIDKGIYDIFSIKNGVISGYRPWELSNSNYPRGYKVAKFKNQYSYKRLRNIPITLPRVAFVDIEVMASDSILFQWLSDRHIGKHGLYFETEDGKRIENIKERNTTFPNWRNPIFPINMIQLGDSYTRKIYIYALYDKRVHGTKPAQELRVVTRELTNGKYTEEFQVEINFFTIEEDLIVAFLDRFNEIKFDVFCGWNTNFFDLPYFYNRCEMLYLKDDIKKMSPIGQIYLREKALAEKEMTTGKGGQVNATQPVVIKGLSCFDMMQAMVKYTYMNKEPDYSLKGISERRAKFKYDELGKVMAKAYYTQYERLINYGIDDVIALFLINDADLIIENYDGLRRIPGALLNHSLANSKMNKIARIRVGKHFSRAPMQTSSNYKKGDPKIPGGMVQEPVPGVHEDVVVNDFAALYPNIFINNNLGIDTLIEESVAIMHSIPYIKVKFDSSLDRSGKYVEYCFRIDFESIYSIMNRIFKDNREIQRELKRIAASAKLSQKEKFHRLRELAFKLILVGIYGTTLYRFYAEYHFVIGMCVTGIGREELNAVEDFYRDELGIETIYKDTDSNFLIIPGKVNLMDGVITQESIDYAMDLEHKCNNFLIRRAKKLKQISPLVMKAEKLIKRIIFKREAYPSNTQKKKYQSAMKRLEYLETQNTTQAEDEIEYINYLMSIPLEDGGIFNPKGVKKQYVYWMVAKEAKGTMVPADKIVSMGLQTKRKDTAKVVVETLETFIDKTLRESKEAGFKYARDTPKLVRSKPLDEIALVKGFNKLPKFYKTQNMFTKGADYAVRYFNQEIDLAIKAMGIYVKKKQSSEKYPEFIPPMTWPKVRMLPKPKRGRWTLNGVVTLTGSFDDIPDDFWKYWEVDWDEQLARLLKPLMQLVNSVGGDWQKLHDRFNQQVLFKNRLPETTKFTEKGTKRKRNTINLMKFMDKDD